jgi:hypothetical protein
MGKTGKVDTGAPSATTKRTTTARKGGTSPSTPPADTQPETTVNAAAADGADEQSATARAERIFDDAGQRVGQFALIAGQYLRQFTARAREEAEDIWVEAQNVRGKKP